MYQISAAKNLQQKETIFMILDDWMKKYNTSPKPLVINMDVAYSPRINHNFEQGILIENNDTIKALKKWAIQNQKIVIVSSATIIALAVSKGPLTSPITSLRNQVLDNPKILFHQEDIDLEEDAKAKWMAGVYYVDENNTILNEEQETSIVLKEGDIVETEKKSSLIPGSKILENIFWKNSTYQVFNKYMKTQTENSILTSKSKEENRNTTSSMEDIQNKPSIESLSSNNGLAENSSLIEISSSKGENKDSSLFIEPSSAEEKVLTQEDKIETPTTVVSSYGVEILIPSSVKQTGLCTNYTRYSYFYGKWKQGTMQKELSEEWAKAGKPSENGIATLNGRYLVAVSPKFGKVGDNIDIVLCDGQVIPATIADMKGPDATSEWGHVLTDSGAVDIIEWEASGAKSDINLGSWRNVKVSKIVNLSKSIDTKNIPFQEETEELSSMDEEANQYIQLYSSIYGLKEESVYQIISNLTDNFTSELYCNQNGIENIKIGNKNILCDSKEMAILLCTHNIYQNPEQYGITLEEIKGNSLYSTSLSYAEQIEYISNVLGVDSSLNYAICQTFCGFSSPMFLNKNNPTNIMMNGSYATFPTKTAGFIEQSIELLEIQLEEKTVESIGLRASTSSEDDLSSWNTNVLEIYNYVSKNYDSIFGSKEKKELEIQKQYVLE